MVTEAEWERDLAYLKKAYYDGHYDAGATCFPWPNINFPY